MMRRLTLLGAAAILGLTAGTAISGNPACKSIDDFCVDTNDADAGSGNPLVPVTGELPWQGIIMAGQGNDPTTDGYVVVDGDHNALEDGGDDMLPLSLDGYIGLHATDGLVYSESGNFLRVGGNKALDPQAFVTGIAENLQEMGGGGGGAPDPNDLLGMLPAPPAGLPAPPAGGGAPDPTALLDMLPAPPAGGGAPDPTALLDMLPAAPAGGGAPDPTSLLGGLPLP